jgi:cell division protein FtsL|tara:strand:- start:262 stop:567 length:306 start_codon:yes stop_codon:yes gene_type:complete
MIRYPSFLVIFLILIVGISLYQIKFSINENEIALRTIKAKIDDTKSDIEILNAELSYLKRPERIEKIALNKLELKEILPTDIWNIKDLVEATKSINERVAK